MSIFLHYVQCSMEGKPNDIQHTEPTADERVVTKGQQDATSTGKTRIKGQCARKRSKQATQHGLVETTLAKLAR